MSSHISPYRSPWPDDRAERLRELWADGMSASLIAEAMGGTTRNAVIGKVHRMGLPKRRPAYVRPNPMHRPRKKIVTTTHIGVKRTGQGMCTYVATRTIVVEPPKPPPTPMLPPSLDMRLVCLEPGMCRYPTNAPRKGDAYLFCGHPVASEKPYCPAHCRVAYQPLETRNPKRDARTAEYFGRL